MSERFTPGPWRVNTDYGQLGDVTSRNGQPVAYAQAILGDTRTHERRKANAHLIAAAPTLFEYVNKCAMNGCKEAEYIIKGVTSGS